MTSQMINNVYLDLLNRMHGVSAEVGLAHGRVVTDLARVHSALNLPEIKINSNSRQNSFF